MAGKVDYKQKYEGLRSKYMNAIDVAFRLGVEEGARNAEMEALQQQVAEMEEQAAMDAEAAMMGGEEGMVDENGMPIEEEIPMEEGMEEEGIEGEGDDLGGAIGELEEYVKNEPKTTNADMLKSFHKSKVKEEDKTPKSAKSSKVENMIKKWDEEDEESTENGEIIGQS